MTLFERVFNGNDAVYGLTVQAVDAAIAQYGEEKAISFPDTAYCLPCYYAVTGVKVVTAVPFTAGVILVLISMFLTIIAGLIPAKIASKKDPVIALRTE